MINYSFVFSHGFFVVEKPGERFSMLVEEGNEFTNKVFFNCATHIFPVVFSFIKVVCLLRINHSLFGSLKVLASYNIFLSLLFHWYVMLYLCLMLGNSCLKHVASILFCCCFRSRKKRKLNFSWCITFSKRLGGEIRFS